MGMDESTEPNQIRFQTMVFTADEVSRLAAYRAAIAAGFYTDNYPGTTGGPAVPRAFRRHTTSRPQDDRD
jgi:hypothetical protein